MGRAKIRFVADVHVGNHKRFGGPVVSGVNDRCRRILEVLEAAAEDADLLVVLGDLFDTSNPAPQVVAATVRALQLAGPVKRQVQLLLGNHDMVSTQPGDHALGIFDAAVWPCREGVRFDVTEEPQVWRDSEHPLFLLPFRPEPVSEWFADAVTALAASPDVSRDQAPILCFHAGVRDHNTPKYLWSAPDAIDVDLLFAVMRSCGSKLAVCGNWHTHRTWTRDGMTVIQVGALVPTGFDNPGADYGYCVDVLHNGSVRTVQKPGPRFLPLSMDTARCWLGTPAGADGCYLRVTPGPEEVIDPEELARHFGEEVLALEVVQAGEDTAEQEAEAAEAARTGDTLEGSLREYVQSMPLEAGVDRAAVELKVLNYLGRA